MATNDKSFGVRGNLEVGGSSTVGNSLVVSTSNTSITLKSPDGNIFYLYAGVDGTLSTTPAGRGIFASGYTTVATNVIDYITIATLGNATDFGDITVARHSSAPASSRTRGVASGGSIGGYPNFTRQNIIDYVTIATIGNAIDFGDATVSRLNVAGCSSETRGITAGGSTGTGTGTPTNVIDYITIATLGNAIDFGDLTISREFFAGCSSTTRGVFSGGFPGSDPNYNVIDYITIATVGNATDFGDLVTPTRGHGGCSSATRGLFGGGETPSNSNVIQYITLATTGNSIDFGDLTAARSGLGSTSSSTRGVFAGTYLSNLIDYVQIATLGNAADFGDLTVARGYFATFSNNHGGL